MRDSFRTRLGFILAAAGSAVGLGNIWGFPTQVANHGGAAFLVVYLVVVVILAIPALYTELSIGHQAQANPVAALGKLAQRPHRLGAGLGKSVGLLNVGGAILMLSFYHIIAGWMLAHALGSLALAVDWPEAHKALTTSSLWRDLVFVAVFLIGTGTIVVRGVSNGIEVWSRRLMPLLVVLLLVLIGYIAMQPGAGAGFARYLQPSMAGFSDPNLVVAAMGQAFFSLSIGLGGMMIYGSYLNRDANIGQLAISVAALDTLIAFLAGLLIIPALYVAMGQGMQVSENGQLIGEAQLIFNVLPELFQRMGAAGPWLGFFFFLLLSIAALTSTISLAEVPIAYLLESRQHSRRRATTLVIAAIAIFAIALVIWFVPLFAWTVAYVTKFQLPLSGLFYFIVLGWLWSRSNKLKDQAQQHWRFRLLFWHLRLICPLLLLWVFIDVAFAG